MNTPQPSNDKGTPKTDLIVEAALDLKAEALVALDMRGVSAFADTFLITSGRSSRHVRSIAESIIQTLRKAGQEPLGVEGLSEGRWVLIDANEAVVHIFEPDTREEFALERLWSDAPLIDISAHQQAAPGWSAIPSTP
ncbi:MAG TPA: ribosome silencing factor [Myxococcales bacterium]|jgi:ribosome-associated protein|nr:ribosome silencing factor [Myxococcales bacterium]